MIDAVPLAAGLIGNYQHSMPAFDRLRSPRVIGQDASRQDFETLKTCRSDRWIFSSDIAGFYARFVAILLMRGIASLLENFAPAAGVR